jgi:hypothetical protein
MADANKKSFFRAFLDFFILFSGISTASNLARTQGRKLRTSGIFLIRPREDAQVAAGSRRSFWLGDDAAVSKPNCRKWLNAYPSNRPTLHRFGSGTHMR